MPMLTCAESGVARTIVAIGLPSASFCITAERTVPSHAVTPLISKVTGAPATSSLCAPLTVNNPDPSVDEAISVNDAPERV